MLRRLNRSKSDVDLGLERAMDGAFRGYLHQLRALLRRQWTSQLDLHVDPVEHALFCDALLTILGMDARVPERDVDVLQWQLLPPRV